MANDTEMLRSVIENPRMIVEALNSENSIKWKETMQAEYNSLIKNKTWHLVDKPSKINVIGSKWNFSLKRKPDSSIEKYKEMQETSAPVVRYSTIRLLPALSAKHKLL